MPYILYLKLSYTRLRLIYPISLFLPGDKGSYVRNQFHLKSQILNDGYKGLGL